MIAPSFQLSGPITGSLLLLLRAINPGDTWAGDRNHQYSSKFYIHDSDPALLSAPRHFQL